MRAERPRAKAVTWSETQNEPLTGALCLGLAEGEGFEPPGRLLGQRFSRPSP
jgi:hypothetical protein